jgi:hypothetical protein
VGLLPAKQLTPPAVKKARDGLADTPGMANQNAFGWTNAVQVGHPARLREQQSVRTPSRHPRPRLRTVAAVDVDIVLA